MTAVKSCFLTIITLLWISNSWGTNLFNDSIFARNSLIVSTQVKPIDSTSVIEGFFWHTTKKMESGFIISYERGIYSNKNWFSLHLGGDIARWRGSSEEKLYLASLYLLPRLWLINSNNLGVFLHISAAGLTYMNRDNIDNKNLGSKFMFKDFVGIGLKIGKKPSLSLALNFIHYSNGDIFKVNPGFDCPGVISISVSC